MFKRSITYTDFNDETQTEDFYFHLSKAELIELELSGAGNSWGDTMERIIKENNGAKLIAEMKRVIDMSYGVRSEDGKRFIKTPEVLAEFKQTEAYSALFFELATDTDASTAFILGVMPRDLASEVERISATQAVVAELPEPVPASEKPKELKDMTREELMAAFAAKEAERK